MVRLEGGDAREMLFIFKFFRRDGRAVVACPIVAPFLSLKRNERTLATAVCEFMT